MKNKIILFITILIITSLFSCRKDITNIDSSKYYDKICIEGHVYYSVCIEGHVYYSGGYQLAPKLNDDGTPVKCEGK